MVENTVEDTGKEAAAAIDIQGNTANLTFRDNTLAGNHATGFATEVEDRRAK